MADEVYSVVMAMKAPLAPRGVTKGTVKSIPRVSSGIRVASSGGSIPKLDLPSNDFRMPSVELPTTPQVASVASDASSNVSFGRVAQSTTPSKIKQPEQVANTSIKSNEMPLKSETAPQYARDATEPTQANDANNLSGGGQATLAATPIPTKEIKATPQPTPQVAQKQPEVTNPTKEIKSTPQPTPQVAQKQPEVTNTTPEGKPIQPNYKNPKGTINGAPYDRKANATQLPPAQKNAPGTINGETPVREKVLGLPKAQKNAPGTINGEAPVKSEGTQLPKDYKNPKGTINGGPGSFRGTPTEIPKIDKTKRMTYEIIPKVEPTESEKQLEMKALEEDQNRRIQEYREFKRNRPTMKEIQGN